MALVQCSTAACSSASGGSAGLGPGVGEAPLGSDISAFQEHRRRHKHTRVSAASTRAVPESSPSSTQGIIVCAESSELCLVLFALQPMLTATEPTTRPGTPPRPLGKLIACPPTRSSPLIADSEASHTETVSDSFSCFHGETFHTANSASASASESESESESESALEIDDRCWAMSVLERGEGQTMSEAQGGGRGPWASCRLRCCQHWLKREEHQAELTALGAHDDPLR
jgi:hypothetical protein